jgi:hypothetical protein
MTSRLLMNSCKLTVQETIDFLRQQMSYNSTHLNYDPQSHAIVGTERTIKVFNLRLPLPMLPVREDQRTEDYVEQLNSQLPLHYIVLIQAGHAALGDFREDELANHKTFRSYMVRKRQGKNELTYSAKRGGGGSSKGSQIRYQNGIHFFEEINSCLAAWNKSTPPARILYSCPITLWGYVFNSKVRSFFDKKDIRLQKIPLDVRTPNYDELLRVKHIISHGYLTISESAMDRFNLLDLIVT